MSKQMGDYTFDTLDFICTACNPLKINDLGGYSYNLWYRFLIKYMNFIIFVNCIIIIYLQYFRNNNLYSKYDSSVLRVQSVSIVVSRLYKEQIICTYPFLCSCMVSILRLVSL